MFAKVKSLARGAWEWITLRFWYVWAKVTGKLTAEGGEEAIGLVSRIKAALAAFWANRLKGWLLALPLSFRDIGLVTRKNPMVAVVFGVAVAGAFWWGQSDGADRARAASELSLSGLKAELRVASDSIARFKAETADLTRRLASAEAKAAASTMTLSTPPAPAPKAKAKAKPAAKTSSWWPL